MLAELLPAQIFAILLVFVRLGAALLVLPGFGEPFISPRVRLLLGLILAYIVSPFLQPLLPPFPANPFALALLIVGEVVVGLFFGLVARTLMSALAAAGMMIATVTALANAMTNDPTAEQQGSIIGSLLATLGLLVVMLLDLHHLLLMAIVESYDLFVPGQGLNIGDMSNMISRVVTQSFLLGFQLASPFIGIGLIFYLGMGLLGRLMPQFPVFFVALPLQISMGLVILFFALPMMFMWFVNGFQDGLSPLILR